MKPKNVLFVTFSLDVGGIETLILEMCRKMDRTRYNPVVCSFFEDGRLVPEFKKAGVTVVTAPKVRNLDWSLPFRLSKIMKEHRIDIVHTHNPSVWLYGGIGARLSGLPLIHTPHSPIDYNAGRWKSIEYFLALLTQKIVPVSHYVANYMTDEEKVPRNKIRVIHNGIKMDDFTSADADKSGRKNLGLDDGNFVFICVARLTPVKDHANLITAFAKIARANPAAKLLLAGEGPLMEDLKKLSRTHEVDGSIQFLGNRRDIPQLLKLADALVLSSVKEGMPIVLLEAMASGLPVITTSGGGSPEIVVHNETGLVVPSQNSEALAAAMQNLAQNKALAREMGRKGRSRVMENFTFEKMMNSYYEVYGQVAHA